MTDHHHHHNPLDQDLIEQITTIAKNVAHSPEVVNQYIGLTISHIGASLQVTAAPYLPIRPEEVLVQPEAYDGSRNAIFLLRRLIESNNCYSLLVNWIALDGVYEFDCTVYRPHAFNTLASSFVVLSDAERNEVNRQVAYILTNVLEKPAKEGSMLLSLVFIKNHFPDITSGEQDQIL